MDEELYLNFQRLPDGSLRFRKNFAGRGPKTFHRSDQHLYEDVCELLMADPDIDADEVEVQVENGLVILSGTVETKRLKRLAEELVADIPGVEDVQNNLKLIPRLEHQ